MGLIFLLAGDWVVGRRRPGDGIPGELAGLGGIRVLLITVQS